MLLEDKLKYTYSSSPGNLDKDKALPSVVQHTALLIHTFSPDNSCVVEEIGGKKERKRSNPN